MKTLLLVGGSRGIGAETVRAFAGAGWRVAFTYQNSLDAAGAIAKETGALAIRSDAGDRAAAFSAYNAAKAALRHIDALVYCAGIAHSGLLQDLSETDWQRLLRVNLSGAVYFSQAVLPDMISQKCGRIIYVGSMWGQLGASMEVAYSAAKAGLIGLGRALSREVAPSGVTVNVVSPGAVDTDMLSCYTREEKRLIALDAPMERLGTPGEVARAILFLAGEGASYITGQVLGVNGGRV